MNLDQALQTFIAESRELLEEMENALLVVTQTDSQDETVNAIFRAAHTIKGSAGLFSLDHIVAFTHVVESVLDHVRDGKIPIADDLVALLLSCGDHIGALVNAVDAGQVEEDAAMTQQGAPLIERLRTYLGATGYMKSQPALPAVVPEEDAPFERIAGADRDHDYWHISLRFSRDVLRNGMDPLSFLRYLGKLGTIVGIVTLPDALPAAEEMDPESCYLGFEIAFDSDADKAAIESVFEFVRDDCRLCILPPHSRVSEYLRLIQ
ncbi:MAG TPA: Hpt domain-containing protein, partial [Noviherbaspirillum sp.]|nr:Hpt domain-containing protein [Noviherbaspirillum sp.]